MKLVAAALVALVAAAGSVRAEPLAEADEVLRRVALSLVAAGEAVPAEVARSAAEPAMVETGAAAEALQPNTAPAEEDAPRFREERGFIGDAFDKIVGAGIRTTGKLTSLTKSLVGDNRDNLQQKYEDCLGCRLVWKQVEMDVSNARYIEDVQASFEHNCMDAQKSNIFYKVCEDMYDDMYAMTDDYMSNKYTVDQMCIRAKICTL